MVSTTSFSLIFFFATNVFIDPIICMLPMFLKNDKPVDISSLQQEFPSIIDKIKIIGMFLKQKGNIMKVIEVLQSSVKNSLWNEGYDIQTL